MRRLICLVLAMLIVLLNVPAYALTYDELLQKAEEYINNEEYDKAFACYDLASKNDPGNIKAFIMAGSLHLKIGDLTEANESIENALAIDATNPDAWKVKCKLDLKNEDVSALDNDVLYAEICGADLSEYAVEIASLYAKTGNMDKAIPYFDTVSIDTMTQDQRSLYRRALISCGEKEKMSSLGLDEDKVHDEKLDHLFDSDHLILKETETASLKLTPADFEITDDLIASVEPGHSKEDITELLESALNEADFALLSRSPAGNSGFVQVGNSAVSFYNDKYHVIHKSPDKGVEDTYSNLDKYYTYFTGRINNFIGDEGVVYSPDGKYAAIYNTRFTLMNMHLFMDPVLIDLSTGEMILTATYPETIKEENAGAVTSATFSSDGKSFYYMLYGRFGDARIRLYRYDMNTRETELCFESEKNLYYPHLSELPDGSLLMINDVIKTADKESLVIAKLNNGEWVFNEYGLQLPMKYCYARRINYSANSGYVCLHEGLGGSGYQTAFQIIAPENNFEGFERFLCITKDTNDVVSLTPEEYQAAIDEDLNGKEAGVSPSLLFPYQTIINTILSPDGNYLLIHANNMGKEGFIRSLFLVRIEDLTIKEIKGLNAEDILVGSMGLKYAINIEWNTDELIIGTKDGIKTFAFDSGV